MNNLDAKTYFIVFGLFLIFGSIKVGSGAFAIIGALLIGIGILIFIIGNANEKEKAEEELQKKKKEQHELECQQSKLAHTEGLTKYYEMNEDDILKYQRAIIAMRELGMIMQKSVYQKKEKDWAIMGGIASGVAGPIAGVATAVNAMRDNSEIRAENAMHKEWGRKQNEFFQNLAAQAKDESPSHISMDELEKKYEAILSWSPQTLLSLIFIRSIGTKIDNSTGAVTVNISWKQNDRSICIDGALRAELYTQEGACAGCAYLVFPKSGTVGFEGTLSGICSSPKHSDKYTVKITPVDLWEFASVENPTERKNENLTNEEHRALVSDYENEYIQKLTGM